MATFQGGRQNFPSRYHECDFKNRWTMYRKNNRDRFSDYGVQPNNHIKIKWCDMQSWSEKFLSHPQLADFMTHTEAIVPHDAKERDTVLYRLQADTLNACRQAEMYVQSGDTHQQVRNEIRSFEQHRASAQAKVKSLKRFLLQHPHFANDTGTHALASIKQAGISVSANKTPGDCLTEILSGLEHALCSSDFTTIMRAPALMHNTAQGCILFPRKIGKSQVPNVATMLAFNLVYLTRTASLGQFVSQWGRRDAAAGRFTLSVCYAPHQCRTRDRNG